MNPCTFRSILLSAALLCAAGSSFAQQSGPETAPPVPAGKVKPKAKAKPAMPIVKPSAAKVPIEKQVDINHANKADLMKVPGVTDVLADKIIAGRPYRSKSNLVTHNILPFDLYTQIKGQIHARQTPAK
jgi:DNA uptake protein ComE-like DNA-binding protein